MVALWWLWAALGGFRPWSFPGKTSRARARIPAEPGFSILCLPYGRLASRARTRYVPDMSTQERLLEEIKRRPEPVLIEAWHYLKFLTGQREEEARADVLPSRQVEQEVLDHLDGN